MLAFLIRQIGKSRSQSRSALAIAILWLSVCLGGLAYETGSPEASTACKRYCLSVTPKRGDTNTVFAFIGRRWLPHKRVEAIYGRYCAPDKACTLEAHLQPFRTNSRGGFVFRFRQGPEPILRGPKPRASGRDISFEQWSRKRYHSKLVMRAVSYYVAGRLVQPVGRMNSFATPLARIRGVDRLDVVPNEVVHPSGRRLLAEGAMWTSEVVALEEQGQRRRALG